jgi:hypothetical protein
VSFTVSHQKDTPMEQEKLGQLKERADAGDTTAM